MHFIQVLAFHRVCYKCVCVFMQLFLTLCFLPLPRNKKVLSENEKLKESRIASCVDEKGSHKVGKKLI